MKNVEYVMQSLKKNPIPSKKNKIDIHSNLKFKFQSKKEKNGPRKSNTKMPEKKKTFRTPIQMQQ